MQFEELRADEKKAAGIAKKSSEPVLDIDSDDMEEDEQMQK